MKWREVLFLLDYLVSVSNFDRPTGFCRCVVHAPAMARHSGEKAVPAGAARSAEADEPLCRAIVNVSRLQVARDVEIIAG